jgi:hypothetical protein
VNIEGIGLVFLIAENDDPIPISFPDQRHAVGRWS